MAKGGFISLTIPIVVGVTFFMAALGWNDAIVTSIDYFTTNREFLKASGIEIAAKWIYVGILTVLLFAILYFGRKYLKDSFIKFEAHHGGDPNIGPEGVAAIPIDAV